MQPPNTTLAMPRRTFRAAACFYARCPSFSSSLLNQAVFFSPSLSTRCSKKTSVAACTRTRHVLITANAATTMPYRQSWPRCKDGKPLLISYQVCRPCEIQHCNPIPDPLLKNRLTAGIVTGIPYGFAADKYGKKPVLILCVAGMSMASLFYTAVCFWPQQFPVRLTWVSPAFMLIGGGNAVLSSVVFSALSDLVPGPYRATTFFTLGAAVLVTELVVSPVASVLMQANLWLPIFLGIILFPVCILLVLCMEETKGPSVFSDQASPGLISADSSTGQDEEVERGHKHSNIWVRFCHGLERLKEGTVFFVAGNYRVAFLLSTLLTTTFGKTAQEMMLQFARRRFKWSWSEAGNLISYKAASTLVLLTILLPMANFFLVKKWAMRAIDKDLFLAKISSMLLTVGNLVICVSATSAFFLFGIMIWCLGSAYSLVLRSLLTQLAEPHHRAALFTTAAILENIGGISAGPVLAASFRIGLSLGDIWAGLPFLLCAILSMATLAILYSVRA
ncbi:hypothetical protein J3459_006274 [Metarhizium acridum]|nr:hypothetical protein J3459_006274 [Metarhizium acridum]